jgi:integrase
VASWARARRGFGQLLDLQGIEAVVLEDRSRRKARRPERRLRFLQPAERDALLRAVLDDELGAVERPLYLTAAITGLGQGELIALPRSDVDSLARRIGVADNFPRGRVDERDSPKSHEGRSVPMAYRVAAELERHFQRTRYCADTDHFFWNPRLGNRWTPRRWESASRRPSSAP